MSSAPVQAHRASVNGLDTYYEDRVPVNRS